MNVRLVLAPALVGALLAGTAGAGAAGTPTPTLDGKKVRSLTATYTPAAQDHDSDNVTDLLTLAPKPVPGATSGDRVNCAPPRCGRLTFLYAPAKGVKGGLFFRTSWTNPGTDIDLNVVELDSHGFASKVASCGGSGGTAETVYIAAGELRPGKRYAIVNDFYRVAPSETVKTSVTFPSPDKSATTVPSQVNDVFDANCSFSS